MEESKFVAAQQRLREYIDQNGLRPGDGLPSEGTLATELGISRISLREATRSLQTLGVIEAKRGKGLFVSEFSFQPILDQLPYGMAVHGASLHEVLVVRETLEEGLIESVAKRINDDIVDDLDRLVDEMEEWERLGRPLNDVDKAFHLRLFEPLGNKLVTHLIEIFWVLSDRLRGEDLGVPMHVAQVHRDIVLALRSGERLVPAMSAHFTDIRNRMEKHESSARR